MVWAFLIAGQYSRNCCRGPQNEIVACHRRGGESFILCRTQGLRACRNTQTANIGCPSVPTV